MYEALHEMKLEVQPYCDIPWYKAYYESITHLSNLVYLDIRHLLYT